MHWSCVIVMYISFEMNSLAADWTTKSHACSKAFDTPTEQDQEGEEYLSDGVKIPDEAIADDGHDQAEDVDDNVVPVVNEEDMDRGMLPVEEAVDHQDALGQDCMPVRISQSSGLQLFPYWQFPQRRGG